MRHYGLHQVYPIPLYVYVRIVYGFFIVTPWAHYGQYVSDLLYYYYMGHMVQLGTYGGIFIFCNSLTHISQFLHIFIFVPPKGDHDETSTKTKG